MEGKSQMVCKSPGRGCQDTFGVGVRGVNFRVRKIGKGGSP